MHFDVTKSFKVDGAEIVLFQNNSNKSSHILLNKALSTPSIHARAFNDLVTSIVYTPWKTNRFCASFQVGSQRGVPSASFPPETLAEARACPPQNISYFNNNFIIDNNQDENYYATSHSLMRPRERNHEWEKIGECLPQR